jgi:hypothetical protein
MIFDKSTPVALIANDAGSANLLTHFFIGINAKPAKVFMVGPAQKIWKNHFPDMLISNSIKEAISGCSTVITATGWQTDFEHKARILAKEMGIHSIACLDHWVNYKERFIRNYELVLPDEIWVFDDHAMSLASRIFPDTNIFLQHNFYLEHMINLAKAEKEPHIPELLYLSEPMRNDWGMNTQGEFQALDFFLQNIEKIGLPNEYNFIFRFHPSEDIDKYKKFLDERGIKYIFDINTNLSSSLGRASWIVGCQTYAMVIACALEKEVFSSLPPQAPELALPYKEIQQLKNL